MVAMPTKGMPTVQTQDLATALPLSPEVSLSVMEILQDSMAVRSRYQTSLALMVVMLTKGMPMVQKQD
jgi:hypothetical protein